MEAKVEDVKQRPDLDPARGWTTNPNSYRKPTYYEVLGVGLAHTEESKRLITEWVEEHKKHLAPGVHRGQYSTTEVELHYDSGTWFLISYYTYDGD